jgi:hypothetical protein
MEFPIIIAIVVWGFWIGFFLGIWFRKECDAETPKVEDKYRPAVNALAQIRDQAQAALRREEFSLGELLADFTAIFALAANTPIEIDKIRQKERNELP